MPAQTESTEEGHRAHSASRWHKSSCVNPDILVEDSIPCCKSCYSRPSLQDIISQHESSNQSSIQPPPDESSQDLKLWWPQTVPYCNQASSKDTQSRETEPLQHASDTEDSLRDATKSTIYPRALEPTEFRLLRINSVSDKNSPVHATVETYSDDNYPEYETVSYTWGGEDGDSRLCRPIFIGLYWDVLPQTENCWQLLRFVRPEKGARLIWIDAICINQKNVKERAAQVAKMAQIYTQCTKVILYLGPDTAPILDNRFPLRRSLYTTDLKSLKPVLAQRYFTRIWVIQELILSPCAVIRIGQTDFYIDSATQRGFSQWENTVAPWLQYATRQRLQVLDSYEALEIISRSQSADPRDRLFGILGLLPNNEWNSKLRPDYSSSNQHVWIGFFAHCLLREETPWFLFHASGVQCRRSIPSWVPDWDAMQHWEYLKGSRLEVEDFAASISNHIHKQNPKYPQISGYNLIVTIVSGDDYQSNQRASICSRTGTLFELCLQRLFSLPSSPVPIQNISDDLRKRIKGYQLFQFDQGKLPTLYLASKVALDKLIRPMCDHLFLLHTPNNVTPLVLREYGPASNNAFRPKSINQDSGKVIVRLPQGKQYHLVATCLHVFFSVSKEFRETKLRTSSNSSHPSPHLLFKTPIAEFGQAETAYSKIGGCRRMLDGSIPTNTLNAAFAGGIFFNEAMKDTHGPNESRTYWTLLPLIVTLQGLGWEGPPKPPFDELYLSCFDPKYEPKADRDYFQVSIPASMWPLVVRNVQDRSEWVRAYRPQTATFPSTGEYWQRRYFGVWLRLDINALLATFEGSRPRAVHFRISRDTVQRILRTESKFDEIIDLLIKLSAIPKEFTIEELINAIKNPKEEYKSILLKDENEDFTIDGRPYYVDIL
ncbi:heterokaryon incompatibility protein-domain-containing protein [Hypoxylon cercidicola]|nr:heterokaryon incompatibility protein-domain-containing protein [Hypoxylon cercidicola]